MFRDRDQFDDASARGHEPAALVADQVIVDEHHVPARRERRAAAWCRRFEDWCGSLDLAPDLAADIGSKRWLRGAGTMMALSVFAISLWPDFSHVEAAAMLPQQPAIRDEFRSQMIMPLALGAESGRHMGATSRIRPLTGAPERATLQLVATLGQGDSVSRILARAGVGEGDIAQVGQLVGTAMAGSAIAPGTQFDISLGRRPQPGAPRVLQSIDFRVGFDLDLTVERQGDELALVRRPIATDTTPLRIRGVVGSSLYRSARNAGAPIAAIQSYLRAIDSQVSLESDLAAGDAFDIVVAYKRSAKGERQLGDLLYAGLERGGKPRLQLLRWGASGQMVAAAGLQQPSESRTIGAPVAGRITSTFGMRRHPVLGFTRMHAGIDFGAGYGSPIYAVADGLVSFAGRHGGHGNYVRLDHGGSNGTGYGHMSRIAVSPGSHVRAGQVIGYVGSSGLSTGPHLHFEAYQSGRTVNPMGLRFVSRPQIDVRQASAFKQRLAQILAIRPGAALGSIAASARAATRRAGDREIDRLADQRDTVPVLPNARAAIGLAVAGNLPNHN